MNQFIENYLENIIPVPFEIETSEGISRLGEGVPRFTVTIKKMPSKKELMTSTSLTLGEAYMRGDLEVDRDLYEVLDLFMGKMDKFTTDKNALKSIIKTSMSKKNQRREVRSHYDIGNDFYELWLDETLSYSCGYFKTEEDTLYQAQINKVDHILEKLHLEKGMRLLDIGCGWGFLLKRAAKKYGVHGVGITLSEEQKKKFQEDIVREGMTDLLEVRLLDY